MAVPIVTQVAGRVAYRLQGKFISRATYLREIRRSAKGRFGSPTADTIAEVIRAQYGPPVGGGDWISRVQNSFDRFRDIARNA